MYPWRQWLCFLQCDLSAKQEGLSTILHCTSVQGPHVTQTYDRSCTLDINRKAKKKEVYIALSRPTVKCEKTGSGFLFLFFFCWWKCQILGDEFAKICIQWLKKALVYMRFDCIPPEFSPFRNFKKNIGKLNSLTVRKKKKKKKKLSADRPNFQILVGWGQHNNFFFFWPNSMINITILCTCILSFCTQLQFVNCGLD